MRITSPLLLLLTIVLVVLLIVFLPLLILTSRDSNILNLIALGLFHLPSATSPANTLLNHPKYGVRLGDRLPEEYDALASSLPDEQTAKTKVLTLYLESPSTLDATHTPLPNRQTSASRLQRVEYPHLVAKCDSEGIQQELPIDDFPENDPFLPWLHDYHVSSNGEEVRFVAQNKRRCETGEGKESVMRHWEPQVALFQSIPVSVDGREDGDGSRTLSYRLSTPDRAATAFETRFLCHFHNERGVSATTFSRFFFNYEYVLWRKRKLPMYKPTGADVGKFEMSQLLFACPIPTIFRKAISQSASAPTVHLDLVPIRTPPRRDAPLLTAVHMGESLLTEQLNDFALFNATHHFGADHVLPPIVDSGRWANVPLCRPSVAPKARHRLVACTWTSASYLRRGDATVIADSAARLKEWIVFHKLVGMDQIYVYDNTQLLDGKPSPLRAICAQFSFVTYVPWPAKVCSNNRPNFKNPGERSSQYAAEAACRVKYGDFTDWMAFIDTDEYLVPMRRNETWHGVLSDMERQQVDVLKLPSSRGRPRLAYMDVTDDPDICVKRKRRVSNLHEDACAVPRSSETFLRVYK